MPPVRGRGAGRPGGRFAPPVRNDLPKHDLTGGNYWMPEAMQWLDARGRLKFGGLTAAEISGMNDGALRARSNLEAAASLSVEGNRVKVINLTSHKLISGYPEGRRMWLNIQWFDANGVLIAEDGAYGDLATQMDLNGDGSFDSVRTLLDLHDHNTRVYEVHGSFTQEWASQLIAVSSTKYSDLVIGFDRITGQATATVADVAAQAPGTAMQSFHFVLNNHVLTDTRIPGYGYSYNEAKRRNALPVPETQYGNPGPGGEYNYWDELSLNVPAGAATASIRLMYQPTSWEYVQFLYLANETNNPQLVTTGKDFLDAWLATGMAEPHVMASTTWTNPGGTNNPPVAAFTANCVDLSCTFDGSASSDSDGNIVSYDWAFGDGSTATGQSASYSYAADGSYNVSLTVTDDAGDTGSITQTVSVTTANLLPSASFTYQCENLVCSFNGSSSSDIDGSIDSYTWDFGDGSTPVTVKEPIHTYTFGTDGIYNVSLTVSDNEGATASVTQTISVVGVPINQIPTASFTFQCTDLGCNFDGSASSDVDGSIVSYAWEFGDGNTGSGPSVSHIYAAGGSYTVTLSVTDNDDATGSISQTVSVVAPVNLIPTASFTLQCTNLTCSFDGSSSSDSDGNIIRYAWLFGDGTTATGVTVNHTYAAAGSYTVSLTVTDDANATDTATQSVTVSSIPGPGPGPRGGRFGR
ncbi:MAG: PKD domain-containing protein [Pseudomonadota bacterium]